MRAGPYAVVDGVTYSAGRLDGQTIWIDVPECQPAPEGITRPSHPRRRGIQRSATQRLFYVTTSARWKGREVAVDAVVDGEAMIEAHGAGFPGSPELKLVDHATWRGHVPVESLTDVVEDVVEVAL